MHLSTFLALGALVCGIETALTEPIDRHAIVSRYNPTRNASSTTTPMQVGNGNFAFGADVTGLQTFEPFAIMSSWGWKNDTLPPGRTWEDVANYRGESWDFHGRPMEIMYGGDPLIQQWLISNPNRVNLGRVGLLFFDARGQVVNVTENDLVDKQQKLDLWTGALTSQFVYDGQNVTVTTTSAQSSSAVGIAVHSSLLLSGRLGLFLDFPWNDGKYFSAPFVGSFDAPANHTTNLTTGQQLGHNIQAEVSHTLDSSTFITSVGGDKFSITRDSPDAHRYSVKPQAHFSSFSLSVSYSESTARTKSLPAPSAIAAESSQAWTDYWTRSGFVDVLTGSSDSRAEELQRRIVLSRYLMRVNEAGNNPPQESGLTNNGWYGKFHMEMVFWHMAHWQLWNNWDLVSGAGDSYQHFLSSSIERAQVQQNFSIGARWSKMTDPSGRSAPGEINELLIWQQPHPLIFAEYEYRSTRSRETLERWKDIVNETANWMAVFAWYNQSTGYYDIGPPMYVVAENTQPNITRNPSFELAYWKYGLGLAQTWLHRLDLEAPDIWQDVKENLAPLPIENGLYAVYEGIEPDFWTNPTYINDHPALVGLHGWLPPVPGVNLTIAKATADKAYVTWNITNLWGWDFPMLAMSAARNGETDQAVDFLLHPLFKFDDVGMPTGGVRVPTPYFPGSGALLYAVAMMARGWDGSTSSAPGFPNKGWNVRVEGINMAL
ncbi:Six-hairpin glycosidase-like protein [Irpex rosettiformis]|uniref:Six-hairpin glycosidase-like protein n=1 Tax=Irpex rosettiformis TaxID=378272 RepID=A0ACB8TZ62_9APHY|nr:Six-hairpin glycosidase-like protein [Irpex rosettiformis]